MCEREKWVKQMRSEVLYFLHVVWSMLQFVNLSLFVLQIYYHFISSIWVIFVVILFEGLLGGAAYVNSFYQISKKVTTSVHLRLLSLSVEGLKLVSN